MKYRKSNAYGGGSYFLRVSPSKTLCQAFHSFKAGQLCRGRLRFPHPSSNLRSLKLCQRNPLFCKRPFLSMNSAPPRKSRCSSGGRHPPYLPALVMIISVPISWNLFQRSAHCSSTWISSMDEVGGSCERDPPDGRSG